MSTCVPLQHCRFKSRRIPICRYRGGYGIIGKLTIEHCGRSSARSDLAPCRDFREGLLGDKKSNFFLRRIRLERRYCNNDDVFITMSGFCAPKPFATNYLQLLAILIYRTRLGP